MEARWESFQVCDCGPCEHIRSEQRQAKLDTGGAERVTTPTAPKYRTTTQACSCPGYWYRRTCNDSAPTIVFAHGRGGNHMSWWQQVAA